MINIETTVNMVIAGIQRDKHLPPLTYNDERWIRFVHSCTLDREQVKE
jgi:hypothetical protein